MTLRFPRKARLTRSSEFEAVYREGMRMREFPLRVRALRRGSDGQSRLGVAVSKRVGSAVVRNRWKRAIREAFRAECSRLPAAHDIVVSVEWPTEKEDVRRVGEAFRAVVEKLLARGDSQRAE